MKIPARIAVVLTALFAVACFVVAYFGFSSLGRITDPVQLHDAKGYAWFWTFLGCVILAITGLTWWAIQTEQE